MSLNCSIDMSQLKRWRQSFEKKLNSHIKGVQIGYFQGSTYPDGTEVAKVAAWNNYGTKSIPPRPFMNNAIRRNIQDWNNHFITDFKRLSDMDTVWNRLGVRVTGDIKKEIDLTLSPPNKPETVKAKKSSHPLINTGFMKNVTSYRLIENN